MRDDKQIRMLFCLSKIALWEWRYPTSQLIQNILTKMKNRKNFSIVKFKEKIHRVKLKIDNQLKIVRELFLWTDRSKNSHNPFHLKEEELDAFKKLDNLAKWERQTQLIITYKIIVDDWNPTKTIKLLIEQISKDILLTVVNDPKVKRPVLNKIIKEHCLNLRNDVYMYAEIVRAIRTQKSKPDLSKWLEDIKSSLSVRIRKKENPRGACWRNDQEE